MFSRTRVATKFFAYGLVIGLLFAPGSGAENRERLKSWISEQVSQIRG
jgi:gas vesicle protein